MEGGRIGEAGAHRLAQQLRGVNLPMARLKTGTPPRLDGRTIDWARLGEQESDSAEGANWTCSTWNSERTVTQIFWPITPPGRKSVLSGKRVAVRVECGWR